MRSTSAFGAYPGTNPYSNTGPETYGGSSSSDGGANGGVGGFRAATPNKKGQYSDSVLSELESQNEDELQGMTAKVRMLKDVCVSLVSARHHLVVSRDSRDTEYVGGS